MDLSIIIVSWRVRELLEQSLESVFQAAGNLALEVFVVDNDSQDGTVEMIRSRFPQVHLLANSVNHGFAKANNQALRLARGRYVLLLNPDTIVFPDTFTSMFSFMEQHPAYGLAGCRLLNPDRTLQPSIKRSPTFADQFLWLFKLHHFLPRLPLFKKHLAQDFNYDQSGPAQQIMGAFFWLRRDAFNEVGLMDEGFWLWFEEVDYCARMLKTHWRIGYNARAQIIHYFGQSFRQRVSTDKQKIFNRSLSRYFRKHHSRLAWFGIQLARPFSLALTALHHAITKK